MLFNIWLLIWLIKLIAIYNMQNTYSKYSNEYLSFSLQYKTITIKVRLSSPKGIGSLTSNTVKSVPTQYNHLKYNTSFSGPYFLSLNVYNLLYLISKQDAGNNRIGQWLNESSNGTFLQLHYKLNSEAPVGTYRIEVWNEDNNVKFSQSFMVEKYGTFCSSPNLDLCVVLPGMRITNCHVLPHSSAKV